MKTRIGGTLGSFALFAVAVSLAACSSSVATPTAAPVASAAPATQGTAASGIAATAAAPATAGPATAGPAAQYKVAYLPTQIGQPVTDAWGRGMKTVFDQSGNVTLTSYDGQAKAETQVSLMNDLINQNVNVIVLQPVDAAALTASVTKAESKGIFVITLNTDTKETHAAFIGMMDIAAGNMVAVGMCKQINNAGNVAIIQAPAGATLGANREKGFRDGIAANCPNVKIVGAQIAAAWDKNNAITVMNAFLQANSKLDGVFAANDNMAEGAVVAAKAAGRLSQIKIWGANGQKSTLALIESGDMGGTAYNNAPKQGETAANMALYLLTSGVVAGKEAKTGEVHMAPFSATKDTVSQISASDRW